MEGNALSGFCGSAITSLVETLSQLKPLSVSYTGITAAWLTLSLAVPAPQTKRPHGSKNAVAIQLSGDLAQRNSATGPDIRNDRIEISSPRRSLSRLGG